MFEPFEVTLDDAENSGPAGMMMVRVMSEELAGSRVAIAERLALTNGGGVADFVQRDRTVAKVEEIRCGEDAGPEFAKRLAGEIGANRFGMLTRGGSP